MPIEFIADLKSPKLEKMRWHYKADTGMWKPYTFEDGYDDLGWFSDSLHAPTVKIQTPVCTSSDLTVKDAHDGLSKVSLENIGTGIRLVARMWTGRSTVVCLGESEIRALCLNLNEYLTYFEKCHEESVRLSLIKSLIVFRKDPDSEAISFLKGAGVTWDTFYQFCGDASYTRFAARLAQAVSAGTYLAEFEPTDHDPNFFSIVQVSDGGYWSTARIIREWYQSRTAPEKTE